MSEVSRRDDGSVELTVALAPDAEYAERIAAAHQLRLHGHSWREIARLVEVDSDAQLRVDVRRWLQTTAQRIDADARMEALQLELERLDALTAAYLPVALAGDTKSAEIVLRTSAARSKYLDFEGLHTTDAATSRRTIVVPVAEGDYADALRAIVAGDTG